ncbi:hypothetical protein [Bergeyella zoohelcum]|uniref:Uncharacterized protein n=2 Tax=Bergeyella zoohelcum TaxID=1015 RepID=K1LPC7_9FLAO|nr:hypothetical protein [Bergeyella zoohelcum]EKB56601.1 hypothetical protein HMPREF9699_01330 [Bergeyella zoohelcum ATCC 43767]MDY6026407.1 hypothetical protein [Bergeyella zoohelcum]SUV48491.1 Uncharacterised protein [Bergeyella zoohelcum]VDH05871.1 Uncharacterised protein [Bergeyella zoohelcum]
MEDFTYPLAIFLADFHDKAKEDKKFIYKILEAQKEILKTDEVSETEFIKELLDEIIKLHHLCEAYKDEFYKFLHAFADLNYIFRKENG